MASCSLSQVQTWHIEEPCLSPRQACVVTSGLPSYTCTSIDSDKDHRRSLRVRPIDRSHVQLLVQYVSLSHTVCDRDCPRKLTETLRTGCWQWYITCDSGQADKQITCNNGGTSKSSLKPPIHSNLATFIQMLLTTPVSTILHFLTLPSMVLQQHRSMLHWDPNQRLLWPVGELSLQLDARRYAKRRILCSRHLHPDNNRHVEFHR